LLLLVLLFYSCSEEPEPTPDEILTGDKWVSERFIYQGQEYDSLIVLATAKDTIDETIFIVYPGEQLRASSWMELWFYTPLDYQSTLRNKTSFKCVQCIDYLHIIVNDFPTIGRFSLVDEYLETEIKVKNEWEPDGQYKIEFMEHNRIRIDDWLTFPVLEDDPEVLITQINDFEVEPGGYTFDVIFKPVE